MLQRKPKTQVKFALSYESAVAGRFIEENGCFVSRLKLSSMNTRNVQLLCDGSKAVLYPDEKGVPLLHAPMCPLISAEIDPNLLTFAASAALIVRKNPNSQIEEVLLTRRSESLKTWSGAWVVPGGHIDLGEIAETAALREVQEEIGLKINNNLKQLCIYESVYPSYLASGKPSRTHALVYFLLELTESESNQFDIMKTKWSLNEVSAAVWVPKHIINLLVDSSAIINNSSSSNFVDKTIGLKVSGVKINEQSGIITNEEFDVSDSLQTVLGTDGQIRPEHITTGTLLALKEWIRTS